MGHGHGKTSVTVEEVTIGKKSIWQRLPMIGVVVGLVFLGISVALGSGENAKEFYYSYLTAFFFFLTIALGGLFFVMINFATHAGWSIVVRRIAENLMGTLPLFALLFIPIAINVKKIYYKWADMDVLANDDLAFLVESKLSYLNQPFFLVRAAFFLACWALLAWWFRSTSLKQDKTGDHNLSRLMAKMSAPGLAVFSLTMTFAAFDWVMSLDPHWFSTIFGVYIFAGSAIAVHSVIALVVMSLRRGGMLNGIVHVEHDHDLGKFVFGFTVFWTYIAFSQFVLIWYANIPEETLWYFQRSKGGWEGLSYFLFVGHFILPFFFLLSRNIKRRPQFFAIGCIWLLMMHYLDHFWLIKPILTYSKENPSVSLSVLDFTTFFGIGGLFIAAFAFLMTRSPIVPVKDPRLSESLTHVNRY